MTDKKEKGVIMETLIKNACSKKWKFYSGHREAQLSDRSDLGKRIVQELSPSLLVPVLCGSFRVVYCKRSGKITIW